MRTAIRLVVVLILLASVIMLGKNIANQASKFKEIYQAEGEARKLADENENLRTDLDKEKSSFSLEGEARDKLGYQKKGEVLYVIPNQGNLTQKNDREARQNWEEWLDLILR
ncbi:MAG TPA: septum formation initiator family protein [Candidatus Nanoarchaeia archaeon]